MTSEQNQVVAANVTHHELKRTGDSTSTDSDRLTLLCVLMGSRSDKPARSHF